MDRSLLARSRLEIAVIALFGVVLWPCCKQQENKNTTAVSTTGAHQQARGPAFFTDAERPDCSFRTAASGMCVVHGKNMETVGDNVRSEKYTFVFKDDTFCTIIRYNDAQRDKFLEQ